MSRSVRDYSSIYKKNNEEIMPPPQLFLMAAAAILFLIDSFQKLFRSSEIAREPSYQI